MLNIRLPATFRSNSADISFQSPDIADMLFRELEGMRFDLQRAVRTRLSAYFPGHYEIDVRFQFIRQDTAMQVSIWVFDPGIRWPAALFARRAWNLSVPIVAHVVEEVFSEQLNHVDLVIDRNQTLITAFAPARLWRDPAVLAAVALTLASLYWTLAHQPLAGYIRSMLGH